MLRLIKVRIIAGASMRSWPSSSFERGRALSQRCDGELLARQAALFFTFRPLRFALAMLFYKAFVRLDTVIVFAFGFTGETHLSFMMP